MNADAKALLAAIVANPTDDTVRLVYADCLEEQGNTARAQFIRLQIEAERHHPDTEKAASLTEQAGVLFAEHWIDWWAEVCEAVGLEMPQPKPSGPLGTLARRMRLRAKPGHPYEAYGPNPNLQRLVPYLHFGVSRFVGFSSSAFRRGFPEVVELHAIESAVPPMNRWLAISPLVEFAPGYEEEEESWLDGPYLHGVRVMKLGHKSPAFVRKICQYPSLTHLEELHISLEEHWYPAHETLAAFRSRQLKSLTLSTSMLDAPSINEAAAVATASHLASLETLRVHCSRDSLASGFVSTLARSQHLSGLLELDLWDISSSEDYQSLTTNPTWTKLRKLCIGGSRRMTPLRCLLVRRFQNSKNCG